MVDQLSLAVNGRENQLRSKLAAFPLTRPDNGNGNGHSSPASSASRSSEWGT